MPTLYEQTGLAIKVESPIAQGQAFVRMLYDYTSYSHLVSAFGGYDEAQIEFPVDLNQAGDWVDYGIGRVITVLDEAQQVVWEGLVNVVGLQYAGRNLQIGPFFEIANRTYVVYSPVITGQIPPIVGDTTLSAAVNSSRSQSLYGIMQKILNGGQRTDGEAIVLQTSYITENAYPRRNETLAVSGTELKITLQCVGFYRYLNNYYYSNTGTGSQAVSARIIAILAAEPNTIFNASTRFISSNALTTPSYANYTNSAMDLVKTIVANGDASFNKWTFGIYANRQAVYAAIPTAHDYTYSLSQGVNSLSSNMPGMVVRPWALLPARFLLYTDFVLGKRAASIWADSNYIFIEQVRYTAPFDFSLTGGRASTFPQKIAQLGLGGI